ncbi:unnamed protein product [Caenorhabditis angaria]|uniref:Uncharacterized protein n=1 Tax=Caenorhabditis angaria TaxID=860376 RepID=A0A9P1INM9_9PELO|nr:unnamed protein product [Caenorhabditis angaria]
MAELQIFKEPICQSTCMSHCCKLFCHCNVSRPGVKKCTALIIFSEILSTTPKKDQLWKCSHQSVGIAQKKFFGRNGE